MSFAPQAQALQITNYPSFLSNLRPGMPLKELVSTIFNFLLMIAGLAAFIMIVWGGVNYLTSVGDPSRMGDAQDQIFKAILGLIVMFASWMILNTINPQLVELKEPGMAEAPKVNPVGAPEVVGYCAADTTYGVKLFPEKNYQPGTTPLLCLNNGQSIDKRTSSTYVYSVQVTGGTAVRIFDSNVFQGRNICFINAYQDLSLCKRWGLGGKFDVWPDNVKSVKSIDADECRNPGITLEENGAIVNDQAKCDGF